MGIWKYVVLHDNVSDLNVLTEAPGVTSLFTALVHELMNGQHTPDG
jgi:hypothetical protein